MEKDDNEDVNTQDQDPSEAKKEPFDPEKEYLPIVKRLIEDGRMPSIEQFLEAVAKVRPEYRLQLTLLREREEELARGHGKPN